MVQLSDTISLMISADYKDRFKAEFHQLSTRHQKLKQMVYNWDCGEINFEPMCPRSIYDLQIRAMEDYMAVLEARAAIEGVDLSITMQE